MLSPDSRRPTAAQPAPRTEPARLCRADGGPPLPEGSVEWLFARSGRRLRTALFLPPGAVRGSVVLSPGRTEPIEKYGEVVADLLARGFVVLTHDWAGQGLSDRFVADSLRCDLVGGVEVMLENYADLLSAYAERLPKPWIAMGHSMGAALTALALSQGESRFARAVLCAPMVEFLAGPVPFPLARRTIQVVTKLGFGAALARKPGELAAAAFETNLLTHDRNRYQQMLTLYHAHPELRLGEPTWRWLSFAVEVRDRLAAPRAAERILCPVSIVAAGDDRIVKTAATRRFAARLRRGSYLELPGAFHEILMETDEQRAAFWRVFDEHVGRA
jgi:lysophospholipase